MNIGDISGMLLNMLYTKYKCGRPTIFCLDRFSRKEKQLNNDEDQVKISHYVPFQGHILILREVIRSQILGKHESEASEDRMSFLIRMVTISVIHNVATVKPKTLKLCKMIHLAALVYVISFISLKT